MLHITYIILCISYKSGFRNQDIRSARPGSFKTGSNQFRPVPSILQYSKYPKSSISLYDTLRHSCTKKYEIARQLAAARIVHALEYVCHVHAGSDLVNRKHHSVESTKFILLVQIYIFCSSSKSALWRHLWPIDTRVAQNTDNRSACTNSKLEQKSPEIPYNTYVLRNNYYVIMSDNSKYILGI